MKWDENQMILNPIPMPPEMSPIWKAKGYYRQFSMCDFKEDVLAYLDQGFVVNLPHVFAMGSVIDIGKNGKERLAWFVRIAVGRTIDLIQCLPFDLPEIAFCRKNNGVMRVFPLARFKHLVRLREKNNGR
jgi:hypothetical protein